MEHLSTSSSPGSPSSLEALSRPPSPCPVNAISWSAWQPSLPLEACQGLCHGGPQRKSRTPTCQSPDGGRGREPLAAAALHAVHSPSRSPPDPQSGRGAGLPVWLLGFQLASQDTAPQAVLHGASAPAQSKGRPVVHWLVFSARCVELC